MYLLILFHSLYLFEWNLGNQRAESISNEFYFTVK